MARITVEDALNYIPNRFDLTLAATYRAREIANGNGDLSSRTERSVASLDALTVNMQAVIDQLTDRALVATWPIDRIDPVLRALFRAAGGEMLEAGTPPKVVITEFVDIAKAFFPDGKEPKFVNAVLDHMAHLLLGHALGEEREPRAVGTHEEHASRARAVDPEARAKRVQVVLLPREHVDGQDVCLAPPQVKARART